MWPQVCFLCQLGLGEFVRVSDSIWKIVPLHFSKLDLFFFWVLSTTEHSIALKSWSSDYRGHSWWRIRLGSSDFWNQLKLKINAPSHVSWSSSAPVFTHVYVTFACWYLWFPDSRADEAPHRSRDLSSTGPGWAWEHGMTPRTLGSVLLFKMQTVH